MPRDGSGVYTLPSGNPVVTNTIISSVWANGTMSDIAAQLNNVLTRDGLLGPTGPFKLQDGTVNAPGLAWASEPGLGFYRNAAGMISLATGGARVYSFNAASPTATGIGQYPRGAGGQTAVSMFNQPQGAADYNVLTIQQQAAGSALIQTGAAGSATRGNLTLDAPLVNVTGSLTANGTVEAGTNGSYNMKWSGGIGGTKYMRCLNNNFEILNSAFNAVVFSVTDGGAANAGSGYRVKAGVSGGLGGNQFNIWYDAGFCVLYIDNTQIFSFSASDERIKKDITPLVPSEAAYMALKPIQFKFKAESAPDEFQWGFSAQNAQAAYASSPVVTQGHDDLLTVHDRPILAQTVLMVQDLINRVKQLENA
jgi:hypothetical protein